MMTAQQPQQQQQPYNCMNGNGIRNMFLAPIHDARQLAKALKPKTSYLIGRIAVLKRQTS